MQKIEVRRITGGGTREVLNRSLRKYCEFLLKLFRDVLENEDYCLHYMPLEVEI